MYYYIKEKIQFEKESQYENCNQYDFEAKMFNTCNNRRRFFLSFYISVSDFSGSQKKKKLFSPECVPKINSRRS